MRIYIASSWRQATRVNALAAQLREAGHTVFDFTQQADITPRDALPLFTDQPYKRYLESIRPVIERQITNDVNNVIDADMLILLLPCGSDAHFELGLAVGCGLMTIVVGQAAPDQFVSMHLMSGAVLVDDASVLPYLDTLKAGTE